MVMHGCSSAVDRGMAILVVGQQWYQPEWGKVVVVLEDGDGFAGDWVLLRTGDSYGGSGCWPAGKTTIVMGDYLVQQRHRHDSGWLCASQACPWITDVYVLVDVGYLYHTMRRLQSKT